MPSLIVIRLVPVEPTAGGAFTAYLNDLTITAFDVSFNPPPGLVVLPPGAIEPIAGIFDPPPGVFLGQARFLPTLPPVLPGDPPQLDVNTRIVQHFGAASTNLFVPQIGLLSVATAVIDASGAAHAEHATRDLRLIVTRGGGQIVLDQTFFNAPLDPGAMPLPEGFPTLPTTSLYLSLPVAGGELNSTTDAYVALPSDGTPPSFADLRAAVELVIAGDPGAFNLSNLTAAQAAHVAQEIAWNLKFHPLPIPKPVSLVTPPPPLRTLELIYTLSGEDSDTENDEPARKQFEANLLTYYTQRDADGQRLANYVFALGAAIWAAEQSGLPATGGAAGFSFPVRPGVTETGARYKQATVVLSGSGTTLNPSFALPAAYFYALGAQLPPQITREQRLELALLEEEQRLRTSLQTALDTNVIVAEPGINPAQAARRLRALGATRTSAPQFALNGNAGVQALVQAWLDFVGDDINAFWDGALAAHAAAHLDLVLWALTEGFIVDPSAVPPLSLAAEIESELGVTSAADVAGTTVEDWHDFFDHPVWAELRLLPPFTAPGSVAERIDAFIRHVQKFFELVAVVLQNPATPTLDGPPRFPTPTGDPLSLFAANYGIPLVFGAGLDAARVANAVQAVFPADRAAQRWLEQAVRTLEALAQLVAALPLELRFSAMEALYARGFTSAAQVQALSLDAFRETLIGTVAFPHAATIYGQGGGPGLQPGDSEFQPVNPDDCLVNCIPPPQLSPLGPVAYLFELLRLKANSSCDDPFPTDELPSLGDILAARRGPLDQLAASRSNLATPLPLLDLVNESLEHVADHVAAALPGPASGAVYDTNRDSLGGHTLSTNPAPADPAAFAHDAMTIFAALPEHSTPATPVAEPGAYNALRFDASHPLLPYDQPLDLNRSYLRYLCTTRCETMRHFRRDITELAIAPDNEPVAFQRHLWRYPLRIEIAHECLGISPAEYAMLFTVDIPLEAEAGVARRPLWELYGFHASSINDRSWAQIVIRLPEFLRRTGLDYCAFLELWRAEFVRFTHRRDGETGFPDCEPCDLDRYRITFLDPAEPLDALRRLLVFIRLWHKLQALPNARYSFAELRDICEQFGLFRADGTINPDFIRQLAAFQQLRGHFRLALTDGAPPVVGATGAERAQLLALWVGPAATHWAWAIDELLDQVQWHEITIHGCPPLNPEFLKMLEVNLDPLSRLAGFNPDVAGDAWNADPTNTLRFAEVLAKIYASPFGVGEILFLFTGDPHLPGDDPFPLQPDNEALESPLGLPDDERPFSLWDLRRKLLAVEVSDDEAMAWSWMRIEAALRGEFGYTTPAVGPDPLLTLGRHFFPGALEEAGLPVSLTQRQYRTTLAPPTPPARYPELWNTPPGGPFRYDLAAKELYTALPLTDEDVIVKLGRLRPLNPAEQDAVRELYFAPRADLAPFALLFANFGEAEERLIQEPDEAARWAYFQREFARCYKRCRIIAAHLAEHVVEWSEQPTSEGDALAWRLLQQLFADENRALSSWEDNSGKAPEVTWPNQPPGGAFAALLGLCGTGLPGELRFESGGLAWRELRGPAEAFGGEENLGNAPIPTVLPSMGLSLTPGQERFVFLRNGFAGSNPPDTVLLGGADGYTVRWRGLLLVDEPGDYSFWAGAPTPEGEPPDFAAAADKRWRVSLQRGNAPPRIIHSYHWPDEHAPPHQTQPVNLRRGVYTITIEYTRLRPAFARAEDVYPQTSGFQLKYAGPDSGGEKTTLPFDRLFQERKEATLDSGIDGLSGAAQRFLRERYTSSMRDIRRTYERAFKALLFAHRLQLSAQPLADDGQSEIGFMLDHPEQFLGISYTHGNGGAIVVHRAWFNLNFLPVRDNFLPPTVAQDRRVNPTLRRRQALFDWWERLYDYTVMRAQTRSATENPLARLFKEAAESHTDNPAQLLRHMGVDMRHAEPEPLVLRFFEANLVTAANLQDDRWAVRVWRAELWLRRLERCFHVLNIRTARPDLWASDDPGAIVTGELVSGNANLTRFLREGCIENDDPRRYEDVKRLNDGLRERGRAALLAYLCGMERVALFGQPVANPKQLSELLLIDVEAGLCQRASRIEEAISAVQSFVQRARLGLEPGFTVSPAFRLLWERRFASFHVWEQCKRRELYSENWIDWDELEQARRIEAFRFLEAELRRAALTIPVPGGMEYWPDQRPPQHPGLTPLQAREPAGIRRIEPDAHGFDLLGTPERHARPSWLAALGLPPRRGDGNDGGGDDGGGDDVPGDDNGNDPTGVPVPSTPTDTPNFLMLRGDGELPARLPFWIQAAIRLGVRFVRVAAAAEPPAATGFAPHQPAGESACCEECGTVHPALVEEYYFWLLDSRFYSVPTSELPIQDAEQSWHDPLFLPSLLHWESRPMVHLAWCRVHNGEFKQPRRSFEGVPVEDDAEPELIFTGRAGDSLRFEVTGGLPPLPFSLIPETPPAPSGFATQPPPGFRYDMVPDAAIALPLVNVPPVPDLSVGVLAAYPYFVYFTPGAPVLPPSLFAPALAVAGWLRAHCRYEAALKWYELVHNPLHDDNRWARCEPQGSAVPIDQPGTTDGPVGVVLLVEGADTSVSPNAGGTTDGPSGTTDGPVATPDGDGEQPSSGREDGDCCHDYLVANTDQARERAILLHYLETLLAWGDALMRRNSPEAFQQARLLYDTIARILGAAPRTVLDGDPPGDPPVVADFVPHGPPLNPRLLALYEQSSERLGLIHACLNAARLRNGTPNRDMPYWGNSSLRNGWQSTAQPCLDDADWCTPQSPYRFLFLVQKAQELGGEVRGLGGALLAAYEKGDAEFLASLRATHERQLLELARELRQHQWREADWQVQALQKTKEIAQTRHRYYTQLIQDGLIAGEQEYVALTGVSLASRAAANVSEGVAQVLAATPDIFSGVAGFGGTPLFYQQFPIGTKGAGIPATIARIANGLAEIATTTAGLRLTQAGWDRREDEWRHQVEVLDIEIQQIERQILAAERRRDVSLRELNNHQRQIEQSDEVYSFLRDKFTSHELYLFLQQETAALHQQMYELALRAARQAERAFNFERGHTARRFVQGEHWDNLREGLLAGDRLQLDLRRMEQSYLDANLREYELTKHVSLRLHFPLQFLQLQATGSCEIELPEWMFDRDYPGHYMRRIKNVSLTIPCVVGPYTGIHCRLTLLSSRTRVYPHLIDPPAPCCPDGGPDNGYYALPDDPRIVSLYAATEAIATSMGQNDSGMFELNFRDERYLPFEYQGAVSRWRIELPAKNNDFDLASLTDVVLHLNYMAREGGDKLRLAANELAQRMLPGAGLRYFDVKHDMPDAWRRFQNRSDEDRPWELPLRLNRAMFPYFHSRCNLSIRRIEIFFEVLGAQPSTHHTIEFRQSRHRSHRHDAPNYAWSTSVECVASADWPDLYHGSLELNAELAHTDGQELGIFDVPRHLGTVSRAFLFCTYEVTVKR